MEWWTIPLLHFYFCSGYWDFHFIYVYSYKFKMKSYADRCITLNAVSRTAGL